MPEAVSTSDEHEPDRRGRRAERPSRIPMRGWRDIAVRFIGHFTGNRVMLVAAGVTFYGLLALFPGLTALVSIYGLFADPGTVVRHTEAMAQVLPPGAVDIVSNQMERIAGQPTDRLSLGFAFGLAIALWSTNTGVKALLDAINVAYGEAEKRSFLHLNAVGFAFTLGGLVFVMLAVALIVVVPVIMRLLGVQEIASAVFALARWPLLLVVVLTALAVLYRYGPSRSRAQLRWITPGAAVAALGWLVVSLLFSWYVANFDTYNETYGSLGGVIAFMMWMWLSAMTFIIGAMIDAEIEHQTARDTTVGPDRPMGERGARVADTVGNATDAG